MKRLSPSQRADLEYKLRHPKDYSERNRICVILGYDEGISTQQLAKTLRISHFTVEEYLREYDSENKTVDADAMLDFFKKLEKQAKAQVIHVILDNARSNENKLFKFSCFGSGYA